METFSFKKKNHGNLDQAVNLYHGVMNKIVIKQSSENVRKDLRFRRKNDISFALVNQGLSVLENINDKSS